MASLKRERIKDQMVQTAARAWGLEESEIEQNFDPLVLLLFEACAAELEKIGNEISDSHARLMDYLAEVILPETLLGAVPASGILQAQPLEKSAAIDTQTQFQLSQKIKRSGSTAQENVDFYLSPIGKFQLLNVSLAYFIAGQKITKINDQNAKETLYSGQGNQQSNTIWLVLDPDKTLENLKELHIYFDVHNNTDALAFYNGLPFAKASIHDKPVSIAAGFTSEVTAPFEMQQLFAAQQDRISKMHKQVAFSYGKRFIHIVDSPAMQKGVPEELKKLFQEEQVKKMQAEKMIFLKIELPRYFSKEVLDTIQCSINAFAAINKKYHSIYYKTDDWLNIIPLQMEGYFLDLGIIKNDQGELYKIKPGSDSNAVIAGEAVIRASGVGKSSSRTVREMINNITETIRDQSAYFSQVSNEYILERLKDIGRMLAGLEDNMQAATDNKEDYHYLVLRPRKNGERVQIEYITTLGAEGNAIKGGMQLGTVSNAGINPKSAFTVSSFVGGKNQVSDSEKKNILRRQLLSGGKIISAEDVKLLCRQVFGYQLKNVKVNKAVSVSPHPVEGFKRTIDVILQFKNSTPEKKSEAESLVAELEYQLSENASPVYPFRVITHFE
ncbi:MAG: type VI secretion system baseplate subunit TssF [Ferruginibacter sp.]